MSATVITCSTCAGQLAVPPEVLGKLVKCPMCKSVFTAPGKQANSPDADEEPTRPERPRAEPPPLPRSRNDDDRGPSMRRPEYRDDEDPRPRRRNPSRYDDDEDEDDSRPRRRYPSRYDDDRDDDDSRPRRRYPSRYDDDRDDYGGRRRSWSDGYEYDEDYYDDRPSWRGRSDMDEAESAVAAPAICLMIYGGLIILGGLALLLLLIGTRPGNSERVVILIFSMIGLGLGGFVVLGGYMLKTMRSYGLAMTAGIIVLLNHPCLVLHILLGVWVLVVLNKREVKRAFRWKAGQQ